MQPFQVPRATIPGQQKRPGPGVPGQRPPGPVPGMRPGGPGFPGPGGVKPPGPIGGPVQQQIPPTNPVEEQPHPKEIVQKEPEKVQPPEPKPEPKIEQPPTQPEKRTGPPQFQPKPQPGPGGPRGMPGPQAQFQPKPQTQQQLQPKPVVAQPEPRVEAPQPKQITKPEPQHEEPKPQPQPVMKQSPEFQQKTQYRSVGREGEDQSSDQLVRLSESLQAMKSLRNNFQGFNVPAGGNEEEEQEEEREGEEREGEEGEEEEEEEQEEYEGEEDDDYVRVEGNEEEEEKEEEGEEGEEEEEEEEEEGEEEEQQYEQEAEVPKHQTQEPPAIFRQEKPVPVKEQPRPQIPPAQINQQPRPQIPGQINQQPRPQIPGQQPRPQIAHNEPHGRVPHHGGPPGGIPQRNPIPVQTKEIPQEKRPSFRAVEEQQHKPQTVQHHPPSGGLHPEAKSPFIPQQEKSLVPEPQHVPVREEPHQHQHHAPVSAAKVKQSQERKRSSIIEKEPVEERIVKEPEVRNDPNLVLKLEQLERELEKERVKVAHLESEQQNLITENATLKHKNSELTAKVNLFSRKGESDRPHSRPDLEALRAELTNGLEECRQLSESTNRVIYEASQYREESESIVRGLEEDKNRLYEQVMELRRQIDEEYNNELESFRQRTELLENRILDYEGNFKLAQTQLQEKNETLQRVTSLNNEIQSVLSAIPQVSYQPTETYVPSIPVHRAPVTAPATTQPAKVSHVEKPETKPAAPAVAKRTNENPFSKDEYKPEVHEQKPAVTAAPQVRKESFPTQTAQPKVQPKEDNSRKGSIVEEKKHVEAEERPPAFKPPQQAHPVATATTVSSEGLTAPPNYRMPNRPKKDEPPKRQPLPVKSFQDDVLASFEVSNDNEPQIQIEAPPQKHEPKVESHPPVHNVTQSRSKIQKMDKSLFNDDAGDNFFGSTQAQPEPTYQYEEQQQEQEHQQYEQTPPEGYYQQEQTATGYGEDYYTQNAYQESYGAVQENPVSNVSSTKQSKSNLRYSQGQETAQKEQQGGAISAEAAENFFDQLGQSQPEPTPQFQPPVQQQRPPFQAHQPHPQAHTAHTQNLTASTQLRNKAHIHSPPKRGKNPFADEEETAQSTDFLSSFQNESFVDRPEAARPMQPKLAANPIQTAGPGPKKIDEPKSGLAKSSVLKKAKGNIPAAMFD